MRTTLLSLAGCALLLAGASTVRAIYLRAEIENVPVAKVAESLEKQIKDNPKDVNAKFNLARLHAMAYALKTDTAPVAKGREKDGAWFDYEPKPIPFQVKESKDEKVLKAAREHLDKAVKLYKEVIEAKPDHLIAQLGHAWAVAQTAKKEDAIEEYRRVIDLAWMKEKDMKTGPLGWHPITTEAGNYLTALLDAEKDKEEIATLKQRAAQLGKVPRPITPVAIPLRDGLSARDLLDESARVRFDADGTGMLREWTWINADAGWLVHDPRATGKITSALQLFGSRTFFLFWDDGYQPMAALDEDGDGQLKGRELDGLAVWHDKNGNGVSEAGEVRPLAEHGIVALSCRAERTPNDSHAVAWSKAGVTFRDGAVRPTFDLRLALAVQADDGLRMVPRGFAGREGAERERMVAENGGSKASEAAVAKGLRWLALHQAPDGRWSLDEFHKHARNDLDSKDYRDDGATGKGKNNDVAGTALGLMPFPAAGITHKSPVEKDKAYVKTVEKGLKWLLARQKADGSFDADLWAHGLATVAVCEAYGVTSDADLKTVAQKAIEYIVDAQDPKSGGWSEKPRQGGDMFVTGVQVMALKSGQMVGLNVRADTLRKAEKWLDSCETEDKGGFGNGDAKETGPTTAVALLCRMYLGTHRRNPSLQNGAAKLLTNYPPSSDRPNVVHEFYATQVMHHMGTDHWTQWNLGIPEKKIKGARDLLVERQGKDGSWFVKEDPCADVGGRVMQTSLALLTLEVYYRHLPLYQRTNTKKP